MIENVKDNFDEMDSEIVQFLETLSDNDVRDIISTIKEVSGQLGVIENAKQVIKDSGTNLKECFSLKPAVFNKWLKYYYNNNLKEEEVKATETIVAYRKLMSKA